MSTFEYLSVLVSIVLGLAITELLSGVARLVQLRHRVRMHAATLCWMAALFVIDVQIWWAAFGRRETSDWNFFSFLLYLAMPVTAYLLSHLVLPPLDGDGEVRLDENFDRNRPWFFALLAALPLVSLVENLVRDGELPGAANLGFHVAILVVAAAGAFIRGPRAQTAVAATGLALLCAYVAVLFLQLR